MDNKYQLIGYEKRTSKSGNKGYVLYITMSISDNNGKGLKLLTTYSFGRSSVPYVTEKFFDEYVRPLMGKKVSITFNQYGNIETISE